MGHWFNCVAKCWTDFMVCPNGIFSHVSENIESEIFNTSKLDVLPFGRSIALCGGVGWQFHRNVFEKWYFHFQIDVTWFYSNCLTDTCGCNQGGDCECFCTSVSAYAHQCCQHGVAVDWRSPRVCRKFVQPALPRAATVLHSWQPDLKNQPRQLTWSHELNLSLAGASHSNFILV